jgi:integrase
MKRNDWFVFIRQNGQRVALKQNSEEHARRTQEAVRTAIAAGQFNLEVLKKRSEPTPPEKPTKQTLKMFYEDTVRTNWEASLARNTFLSYDSSFRIHILPELGYLPLSGLTRDRIKKFVATLRKKTIAHTEPPRPLSKETIRNIVAALRAGLTEAFEANLITTNTAVRLGRFYKEVADFREEIDPFSADEVSTLLQTVQDHYGFESYVLLLVLFHCGLRAGEAAGLEWSDLDIKNRTLLVRRQITRGHRRVTKTRKKRAVDVSTILLAELQVLKKQRQAECLAQGKNEIPDPIFLGPGQIIWKDGKPVGRSEREHVDMDNFRNRVFWKACDKAKIRRRRLHDTRHTFASLLLSNGEPLKYVSVQLGHASIRMTADVYGHLEVGSNRAAMDRLPALQASPRTQAANGLRIEDSKNEISIAG